MHSVTERSRNRTKTVFYRTAFKLKASKHFFKEFFFQNRISHFVCQWFTASCHNVKVYALFQFRFYVVMNICPMLYAYKMLPSLTFSLWELQPKQMRNCKRPDTVSKKNFLLSNDNWKIELFVTYTTESAVQNTRKASHGQFLNK